MHSHLWLQPGAAPPDQPGFPLSHPYVEHVYAGVIGPTSVVVLRRAALLFEAFPEGIDLDIAEFAHSLGLGHADGAHSPLARTLARLDRFGIARWDPEASTLTVPVEMQPVTDRWLYKLPESSRSLHHSLKATLRAPEPLLAHPALIPVPQTPSVGLGRGA